MNKIWGDAVKGILVILAIILSFAGMMIWAISEENKQDKQNFFECTERTQDVEWCYNKFILD